MRKEVNRITIQWKTLLTDRKKMISEMNILTKNINNILLKVEFNKIQYCNGRIKNISKRISTLSRKYPDFKSKIDELNRRKSVIDCQLDENPTRKDIVHTNELYEIVKKWNDFDKEATKQMDVYYNKVDSFNKKNS
ncbi:MAG: hypothetical protein Pg6B_11050 [Candidatus Azobacteroides pseudotrichonymphae]|jgi:predicted  nucleic acid-binding Zn-ribbon protein|nr:MAG: hypothetical protein Pg6B_11050 [Candidatus Azobacteroides pseudotrichonymphae]